MRGTSNCGCSKPICEDSLFSFTFFFLGGGGGAVVFFNCEKRFGRLFGPNKSQNIIENNNIIVFWYVLLLPVLHSNNLIRHHKFQDSSQGFNSLINRYCAIVAQVRQDKVRRRNSEASNGHSKGAKTLAIGAITLLIENSKYKLILCHFNNKNNKAQRLNVGQISH